MIFNITRHIDCENCDLVYVNVRKGAGHVLYIAFEIWLKTLRESDVLATQTLLYEEYFYLGPCYLAPLRIRQHKLFLIDNKQTPTHTITFIRPSQQKPKQ